MLKREAAFESGEWDPLGLPEDGSSGKSSGVVEVSKITEPKTKKKRRSKSEGINLFEVSTEPVPVL